MMKEEPSRIKSDILLRVRVLYVLFIAAGAIVFARLVWVPGSFLPFPGPRTRLVLVFPLLPVKKI